MKFGNHGLADDVLVFDGKLRENAQPLVGPLLILHSAANDHIVPTVVPVFRNAVHKTLDPFGQKQELAVLPLPDHIPAFCAPGVSILDQKIRGKAEVHQTGFHLIFAVLLPGDGLAEILCSDDFVCIHTPFGIALVDIAELTALAVPVTTPPGVPHCHWLSSLI